MHVSAFDPGQPEPEPNPATDAPVAAATTAEPAAPSPGRPQRTQAELATYAAKLEEIFAGFGDRFHVWRQEVRHGKPTKVPYQYEGKHALANDPSTWTSLKAALAILARGGFDGIGVQLGQLSDGKWLVGIDLDLCRNPVTGETAPWAEAEIAAHKSYTEVSPSGCGVKILTVVDWLPSVCGTGGIDIKFKDEPPPPGAPPEGHSCPGIGLYPGRRFFTVTGWHIELTPFEITEATEAFARLATELRGSVQSKEPLTADAGGVELTGSKLTGELMDRIDCHPLAGLRWRNQDQNPDRSVCDFRLALDMANAFSDAEIEAALRDFQHGQIGSGKIVGAVAERQIKRLIAKARQIKPSVRINTAKMHDRQNERRLEAMAAGADQETGEVPPGPDAAQAGHEEAQADQAAEEEAVEPEADPDAARKAREKAQVDEREKAADERAKAKARTKPGPRVLRRVVGESFLDEPRRQMVVKRLLGVGETSIWSGEPKAGKSFLVTSLALAIADGAESWFGYRIKRRGAVIYLVLEGKGGFPNRLRAHRRREREKPGREDYRIPDRFQYVPERLRFLDQDTRFGPVSIAPDVEAVHAVVAAAQAEIGEPVVLIVVDTTARALTGLDENSNAIMGLFMDACAGLTDLPGSPHVLLVGHTPKGGRGLRGGGAATGAADTLVDIVRNEETGKRGWGLASAKDDTDGTHRGFTLEVVVVGQDEDGDDEVSAVVVEVPLAPNAEACPWEGKAKGGAASNGKGDDEAGPAQQGKGAHSANTDRAIQILRTLLVNEGKPPRPEIAAELPKDVKLVVDEGRWVHECVAVMSGATERERKKAFRKVYARLTEPTPATKTKPERAPRVELAAGMAWLPFEGPGIQILANSRRRGVE